MLTWFSHTNVSKEKTGLLLRLWDYFISSDQCALITFCLAVLFHVYPAKGGLPDQLMEMQTKLKAFEFNAQLISSIIESSERIKKTIEEDPHRQRKINDELGKPLSIFHFSPRQGRKYWMSKKQYAVTIIIGLVVAVGVSYAVKHQDLLIGSNLVQFFLRRLLHREARSLL